MGAGICRLDAVRTALAPQSPGDGRHQRLIAIIANTHRHAPTEIDAVDSLEKTMDKMLPRLLAVADDIHAGILLQLYRKDRGVALSLGQCIAFKLPRRP